MIMIDLAMLHFLHQFILDVVQHGIEFLAVQSTMRAPAIIFFLLMMEQQQREQDRDGIIFTRLASILRQACLAIMANHRQLLIAFHLINIFLRYFDVLGIATRPAVK